MDSYRPRVASDPIYRFECSAANQETSGNRSDEHKRKDDKVAVQDVRDDVVMFIDRTGQAKAHRLPAEAYNVGECAYSVMASAYLAVARINAVDPWPGDLWRFFYRADRCDYRSYRRLRQHRFLRQLKGIRSTAFRNHGQDGPSTHHSSP